MKTLFCKISFFTSYYVAYFGVAGLGSGNTITIGNGDPTSDGSTTFTNPPPVVGDEYYVFIRLYSSIDVSPERDGRCFLA